MNLIHDYQYRRQLKRGHELFIIMSVYDLIRFSLLDYSFFLSFCNDSNDDKDIAFMCFYFSFLLRLFTSVGNLCTYER